MWFFFCCFGLFLFFFVFFLFFGLLRACAGGRTRAKAEILTCTLSDRSLWKDCSHIWSAARSNLLTCLLWAALKRELTANKPGLCLFLGFLLYAMPPWCTLAKTEESPLGSDNRVHSPWKHTQIKYFPVTKCSQHLEKAHKLLRCITFSPSFLFTEALLKRKEKVQAQEKLAWNWKNPRYTSKPSQYQTEIVQFRCI